VTILWLNYDAENENLLALVADRLENNIYLIVGDGKNEYVAWTVHYKYLFRFNRITSIEFEVSPEFYTGSYPEGKNFSSKYKIN
jgi:hypothetical protein